MKFSKIKKLFCKVLAMSVLCSMFVPVVNVTTYAQDDYEAVDGTTGAPLGGFGAGAVKFNAMKGDFFINTQPPVDQADYKSAGNSKFQLYTKTDSNVKSVDTMTANIVNDRYKDDAIWPEHMVDFGETNGINVNMTAFSPLDNENYDNMSMPYAFYEITLTNTNSTEAEAAVALQWDKTANARYVEGKGFVSDKWAVYADSNDESAVVSAGNDNGFMTTGLCNNTVSGNQNKTAVKVSLASGESKVVKFVFAWYDAVTDPDGCYYLSKYNSVEPIAQLGLDNFDKLKNNADILVSNMRGSNVPSWFVNQTLNSLANISNNSIYKTDGRVAFAEGEWTCFGTMDQMWHARQIIGALCPYFAWEELEYWARTQRNDGQIHHDFNYMTDTSIKYKLVPWDDTEHADYRNVDKWVDLNCGLIISVYETYQQTGDDERLTYFWPYMKKALERILAQVELYGDKDYPYTFKNSENSYDAGGDPNAFNTSISAVAYKLMLKLADKFEDTELKAKCQTAYDTVVESYRKKYLTNNFPAERISESYFAGQWLAMTLKLGQIWTQEETDYVIDELDKYYHPLYKGLGYLSGTYDEWTPYMLSHYGGLLLNTRRQNQFEFMQKDAYNRQFMDRNYVFNMPLDILPAITKPNFKATRTSGDKQYISTPAIWRNYYDVVGYHRDMSTKELWLEPNILTEMNHVLTDGAYISQEGYGTISCTETGDVYQNKDIVFKPENEIMVSTLHLTDNFGEDTESIKVTINGQDYPFTRSGEGYTKELLVEYNKTVGSDGISIVTTGDAGEELPPIPEDPGDIGDIPERVPKSDAFVTIEAERFDAFGGVATDEMNGITYVTECDDQDYTKYDDIGFGTGAESIEITVSSTKESYINVLTEGISGETIATIDIPNTNGEWQTLSVPLTVELTGTKNIVFLYRTNTADSEQLVNVDKFIFREKGYKFKLDRTKWSAKASANSSSTGAAFDNDATTRWNSSYQLGNEWLQLDLGESKEFNKIVLDNTASKNDYPRIFEIRVSDDGNTFSDVIASGRGTEEVTTISFPKKTARYIKISQVGSASSSYWSVYEMNVFNTDEEYETPIYTPEPTKEPDNTVTEYTYTGTSTEHSNGTKGFDLTKYQGAEGSARVNTNTDVYTFAANVSDAVKAEFASSKDSSVISDTYTSHMINYIGTGGTCSNKPAIINETISAGSYTIYYIGGNSNAITVDFVDAEEGSVTILPSSTYKMATEKLTLTEIPVVLNSDFTGDITFFNSEKWLPDLYAVKIVNNSGGVVTDSDWKVNTVYTADNFVENPLVHSDGWDITDTEYTANYEQLGKPFGELNDFDSKYTFYTTDNIKKTIKIEEKGNYRLNLLIREYIGRGYNVSLVGENTVKTLDCISNQVKVAKLPGGTVNMGVAYADMGELEPGVYTLSFNGEKVNLWFAATVTTADEVVKDYEIKNVNGQKVTVSAKEGGYAVLYAAKYENGILVNVGMKEIGTAGEQEFEFKFVPDKVFLWTNDMKPLDTK